MPCRARLGRVPVPAARLQAVGEVDVAAQRGLVVGGVQGEPQPVAERRLALRRVLR